MHIYLMAALLRVAWEGRVLVPVVTALALAVAFALGPGHPAAGTIIFSALFGINSLVALVRAGIALVACVRRRQRQQRLRRYPPVEKGRAAAVVPVSGGLGKLLPIQQQQQQQRQQQQHTTVPVTTAASPPYSSDLDASIPSFAFPSSSSLAVGSKDNCSSLCADVDSLVSEYFSHEKNHSRNTKRRQQRQKRQTQLRVLARLQVKQAKTLSKVPAFANLSSGSISKIVDGMLHKTYPKGAVLCAQGDLADRFYVVVSGQCGVTMATPQEWDAVTRDGDTALLCTIRVGTLQKLHFFGESALIKTSVDGADRRSATVTAESDVVQVLEMGRQDFLSLIASGIIKGDTMTQMQRVREQRNQSNARSVERASEASTVTRNRSSRLKPLSNMSIISHVQDTIRRRDSRRSGSFDTTRGCGSGGGGDGKGHYGSESFSSDVNEAEEEHAARWKERLFMHSAADFRGGWRAVEAPDDRRSRRKLFDDKFGYLSEQRDRRRIIGKANEKNFEF